MANNAIHFQHPLTGEMRTAPIGFSWTTLFFGLFPALFRSDWKWAIIMFLLSLATFGFTWLLFPFIYNKTYAKELIRKGFKAKGAQVGAIDQLSTRIGMQVPVLETDSAP